MTTQRFEQVTNMVTLITYFNDLDRYFLISKLLPLLFPLFPIKPSVPSCKEPYQCVKGHFKHRLLQEIFSDAPISTLYPFPMLPSAPCTPQSCACWDNCLLQTINLKKGTDSHRFAGSLAPEKEWPRVNTPLLLNLNTERSQDVLMYHADARFK